MNRSQLDSDENIRLKNEKIELIKGLQEYFGTLEEDIQTWLRNVYKISEAIELTDEQTVRLITFKLRGNAQAYVKELLSARKYKIQLDELTSLLRVRFSRHRAICHLITSFLNFPIPETKKKYFNLLNNGTELFNRGFLSMPVLTQNIIIKSPVSIKMILYLAAEEAQSWDEFVNKAEEVAWVAYPAHQFEKTILEQGFYKESGEDKLKVQKNMLKKKANLDINSKNCLVHGKCAHNSEDCMVIRNAALKYKPNKKSRNYNHASNNDTEYYK